PVDACFEPVREDARQIAEDPSAGDVRERADVGARPQLPQLVQVEAMRREQEIRVEVAVADELPDEREAVRVESRRRKADQGVARLAPRTVDQLLPVDDSDARAREVELVVAIDARKL